jgi:hypothetical protein
VGDTATVRLKPLLAHWDGSKWAVVKSPALPLLGRLFGVAKFGGGAFAVGNSGGGIGTFRPLILRLTGTSVRRVQAPNLRGGQLLGVAATSAKNAWAVGKISRGPARILHWNGTAWH